MKKIKQLPVNVLLSADVRGLIKTLAMTSGLREPVPGLLWGTSSDRADASLYLGFYEKSELPSEDPVFLINTVDGTEVLVAQEELLRMLDGHKVVLIDKQLTII